MKAFCDFSAWWKQIVWSKEVLWKWKKSLSHLCCCRQAHIQSSWGRWVPYEFFPVQDNHIRAILCSLNAHLLILIQDTNLYFLSISVFHSISFPCPVFPPSGSWFEFTPHNTGVPGIDGSHSTGAYVDMQELGSVFREGQLNEKRKEKTICYLQGMPYKFCVFKCQMSAEQDR